MSKVIIVYEIPTLLSLSRMKLNKWFIHLVPFLWISILFQAPSTVVCSSLRNYSSNAFNGDHRDLILSRNLSDIIEFSPLNLSEIRENTSILHQEISQVTSPEIITLKLKTYLTVNNRNASPNGDQSVNETNENTEILTQNVSESSLSDIEYVDPSGDFEFWKLTMNKRSRKLNYVDEELNATKYTTEEKGNTSEKNSLKNLDVIYDSENSEENKISEETYRSNYATGRQFLFHPYLPYGKDIKPPDEKISFDDILPVKMVKFIKSMVEEAPWEQMFMKMVRMIVDQFVDKIIEKMFEDKKHDDHFKKRSFEVILTPALVLPTFRTPMIRLKRTIGSTTDTNDQDDDIFNFLPPKRDEQDINDEEKKDGEEKKSWLDHFLDFVFPDSESDMLDEDSFDRLKKRDTTNTHFLKTLLRFFVSKFEKSSGILSDAKDVLRYKMLKEFLPYLYQKTYMTNNYDSSLNSIDAMKMAHRKSPDSILKRQDNPEYTPGSSERVKRSLSDDDRKDDEDRLWQAHSRRQRPPNHRSHDDCSLRKACNAGRLLSRLPSVQEITLQLSNGNEPHWDALLWGMKKKRCSRIFCKRQRSPKGSRYPWNAESSRSSRRDEMVTELPDVELDLSNSLKA